MPTGISILTSKGDPPAKKSVVAKTTFPKLQIAKLTSGPKRRCLRQLGGQKEMTVAVCMQVHRLLGANSWRPCWIAGMDFSSSHAAHEARDMGHSMKFDLIGMKRRTLEKVIC
jgi:hypothetical protein